MHTKFTLYGKRTVQSAFLVIIGLILGVSVGNAQTKWSGVYGNEWLTGKYGQEWLKISVSQKGIHKVTLTGNFVGKANKLHLYHRGVEVALISATNSEIKFYGVPNDGKSDELLYRKDIFTPDTTQRTNPYFSYYSDISAYFLTYSDVDGVRATTVNEAVQDIEQEAYHMETYVRTFTEQYSLDTDLNFTTVFLLQSYLENGKGVTSEMYGRHLTLTNPYLKGDPIVELPIKNLVVDQNKKPELELLLYGRTYSENIISVSVGSSSAALKQVGSNVTFSGFTGKKSNFTLNPSTDGNISDLPINGNLNVKLTSNVVTADYNTTGIYSVTYMKVTYPQLFDMSGKTSAEYNILAKPSGNISKIVISNPTPNALVYDITNKDNPKLLSGVYLASGLNVMVPRQPGQAVTLLVTSDPLVDATSNGSAISMVHNDPASYDFLLVTHANLRTASEEYKTYRNSQPGGSMNVLLSDIKDIYNQFNYGEPSPVAIRRFVDYMTSKGIRSKHNLLLIGHSNSNGNKLVSNKELPFQVPTIGFPGSDVLLVEGLHGTTANAPAIPVGRITATTEEQVRNYKEKLVSYEQSNGQLNWRKNVMHINGGVNPGESDRFSTYYTNNLNGMITGAPFLGTVLTKKKPSTEYTNPFVLDITSDVNNGIGFMSYFGHGNPRYTDYSIGYISDTRRNYVNTGKYPVMYFNGCGVGNIFLGNTTPYPVGYTGTEKSLPTQHLSMSADWLLAKQAGAIAIIGNSFYAFESSSKDYMFALENQIFTKSDSERSTIGKIHQSVARLILTGSASGRIMAVDNYSMANTHQSTLQGDPALNILWTQVPFPVELYNFEAKLYDKNKVQLLWKTAWEKNNNHFVIERSYNAKNFEEIGSVEGKGDADHETSYQFYDSKPLPGVNYYRLKQVDNGTSGASNGNETYSTIVSVKLPNTEIFSVFPNPTSDRVSVNLNIPAKIKSWTLSDMNGRVVSKGGTLKDITLLNCTAGEYVLIVNTVEGDSFSQKIVKQ